MYDIFSNENMENLLNPYGSIPAISWILMLPNTWYMYFSLYVSRHICNCTPNTQLRTIELHHLWYFVSHV
jgi:hypothetical protein